MKINHINKATDNEQEILNILSEECAEVIQAISKILRFGWGSCHPDTPEITNRIHLTEELGDLYCMMNLLSQKRSVVHGEIINYSMAKLEKLKKYSNIDINS